MFMAAGQRYQAEAHLLSPAFNAHHVLKHSSRHTHISQICMKSVSPATVCCSSTLPESRTAARVISSSACPAAQASMS